MECGVLVDIWNRRLIVQVCRRPRKAPLVAILSHGTTTSPTHRCTVAVVDTCNISSKSRRTTNQTHGAGSGVERYTRQMRPPTRARDKNLRRLFTYTTVPGMQHTVRNGTERSGVNMNPQMTLTLSGQRRHMFLPTVETKITVIRPFKGKITPTNPAKVLAFFSFFARTKYKKQR